MPRHAFWTALVLTLLGSLPGPAAERAPTPREAQFFESKVRPVLANNCFRCHGPDKQKNGLRVDSRAALLKGGEQGPALVPGQPEKSHLIQALSHETDLKMPPKKLPQPQIADLTQWVKMGAPWPATAAPARVPRPRERPITDAERAHWAFQPRQRPAVPAVKDPSWAINPIDAFLLARLEAKGLRPNPPASKRALIRRLYYDLIGLPPTPREVEAFVVESSPTAYAELVERLLESPRYGEKWGRHWLDLVRFAETNSYERDNDKPNAWRYRDYVIQAFNTDKPYDRFLLEQLAGDELVDYENAPEITTEIYNNLVATGFLRMAPDATWANITGYAPDRIEVVADEIDILGSAVMGLTLKCARCHSHKFDPLPQRDYYRLVDVLKGAYDEYDWLKPDIRPGIGPVSQDVLGGRLLPYVTTAEKRAWEAHNAKAKRDSDKLPEPRIQALWDRGEPSSTYIYRRGDSLSPGRLVGPGVPSVLTDGKMPFEVKPPWPGAKKTGRRLAFARWLTRPEQPLTGRVAVNRLWKHHFGTGIVKTLGNFGKTGTPPTHPELLDWLAREFVRQGWSTKTLHRLMMTSSTYRQSSAVTPDLEKLDPENALCSRMPLVRLDAEALYDTLLLVAGRLDETRFGPADAVQARPDGLVTPVGTDRGWRRIIYVQQSRKRLPTHLENFDYPQMNPNCSERRESTVAPQALHLMNNGMVHRLAEQFAQRVRRETGTDPARQIERVYLIALSRLPSKEEKRVALDSLDKLTRQWTSHLAVSGQPDNDAAGLRALTTFCHAIVNSAGFIYVD